MPAKVILRKLINKLLNINKISSSQVVYFNKLNFDNLQLDCSKNENYSFLFPDNKDLDSISSNLKLSCDAILTHNFDLLGSGTTCVNLDKQNKKNNEADKVNNHSSGNYHSINWQLDFKSGYQWDANTESVRLKYGNITDVDVKVPWELGRMQHLILLSYASLVCDDKEKYIREYCDQVLDFINSNPIGFGIQWKSSMDVSIRAINIILSYIFCKIHNLLVEPNFETKLVRSLFQHLVFLYQNPEWNDGLRGNHYLFSLVGMIIITEFIQSDLTVSIREYALSSYINELNYQFNSDGSNFEASSHYHLFTSEAVFLSDKFIPSVYKDANYIDKLNKIKRFCQSLLINESEQVRIGDDDGGYLIALEPERILSLNHCNYKHIQKLFDKNHIESGIESYPDFGLYIRNNTKYKLFFRCGSLGQNGKGGHAHNDQLSFVLMLRDKFVIVDTGTYCYTPNPILRNRFRSTENHNVLSINDTEQNYISGQFNDLFWLPDDTKSKLLNFTNDYISGVHFGYGIPCTRSVHFEDSSLLIVDEFNSDTEKQLNYHFHPDFDVIKKDDGVIVSSSDIVIRLSSKVDRFDIQDYRYSPAYGYLQTAKKAIIKSYQNIIKTKIDFERF